MENFENKFTETLAQYIHLTEKPILLAVSGGIDSVVLLHLLIRNGCSVEIMHCNFGLRAKESDLDEKFVHGLSEKYQFPLHVRRFDTAAHASDGGISVQMAARQLRMNFTNELMNTEKFSCVCMAHHLNDNIETFFLNLFRGTGIKGLKGMQELSGRIFRPLLNINRSEIIAYAESENLSFREDSSNRKDDYSRNRIRKYILPVISEQFPQFVQIMQQNFQHFSTGIELFEVLCNAAVERSVTQQGSIICVDLKTMSRYGDFSLLLYHVIEKYGFAHHQSDLIWSNAGNTETTVYESQTHKAFLKNHMLEIIVHEYNEPQSFSIETLSDFSKPNLPVRIEAELVEHTSGFDLKAGSEKALLDANLIRFPLILRKWKKGDVFYPFGMKGKKLISDFFADRKMTAVKKQNTWVLCCGEQVVWLIGQRIDNRWSVRPATKIILSLEVEFL